MLRDADLLVEVIILLRHARPLSSVSELFLGCCRWSFHSSSGFDHARRPKVRQRRLLKFHEARLRHFWLSGPSGKGPVAPARQCSARQTVSLVQVNRRAGLDVDYAAVVLAVAHVMRACASWSCHSLMHGAFLKTCTLVCPNRRTKVCGMRASSYVESIHVTCATHPTYHETIMFRKAAGASSTHSTSFLNQGDVCKIHATRGTISNMPCCVCVCESLSMLQEQGTVGQVSSTSRLTPTPLEGR